MGRGWVRVALPWSVLVVLAATLAVTAYWLLFSTFMIYDDEGYVLLSLKNFSLHGGLYDQVYTQYGPFPYLLYDALHRVLNFDFNNASGRWITLVNWCGTAGFCTVLVARLTRSAVLTAFTAVSVFIYLWVMIHEPIHPGGLIALIVAAAGWAGMETWRGGQTQRFVLVTGVASAALLLTKVNVGIFFAAAAVSWLALNSRPAALRHSLKLLLALGIAILPFALMHAMVDALWVRLFALIFSAAGITLVVSATDLGEPYTEWRNWLTFGVMTVATSLGLIALTLVRGSTGGGVLAGVLLDPIKHPGVYFFAVDWKAGAFVVALASLAFGVWSASARLGSDLRWKRGIAVIRLIAVGLCLCGPLGLIPTTFAAWAMSYGVSLAWLFAVPLSDDPSSSRARTWIALLFVFQSLHVYPVAGSQLNWGTFLWVPLMVLGLHDALPVLRGLIGRAQRWVTPFGAIAATAVMLVMGARIVQVGYRQYVGGQPVKLTGTGPLRLQNDIAYPLRIAVQNIQAHGDMLFSFPGLYSANLWSGLPTPSLSNATHWFSLLSAERQQQIINQLEAHPRALLLIDRELLDFLARHGFATRGLLYEWLMSHFEKSQAFEGYEIWVKKGRSIAGLMLAHVGTELPGSIQSIKLTMPSTSQPIARFELCNIDLPDQALAIFGPDSCSLSLVRSDLDGVELGSPVRASFPLTWHKLATVRIDFSPLGISARLDRLLLVARSATGDRLGELLLVE